MGQDSTELPILGDGSMGDALVHIFVSLVDTFFLALVSLYDTFEE